MKQHGRCAETANIICEQLRIGYSPWYGASFSKASALHVSTSCRAAEFSDFSRTNI